MGADERDRRALWLDVLAFDAPIQALEERVACLTFDGPVEAARLEHAHVVRTLRRYLDGELDADSVARWASLLEMRDDLDFGDDPEPILPDVLFELATPEINHPVTNGSAARLIALLNAPRTNVVEA